MSGGSYRLPFAASIGNHARIVQLNSCLRLATVSAASLLLASCAVEQTKTAVKEANSGLGRMNVRTTAYCRNEAGGVPHNAIGGYLSGRHVMSAAADWSHFPLGTRFKIVGTNDEYVIDDYGWAMIGTNTIDLYKPSRLEMRRWGVRKVDIDIEQWGSDEQSLKVLAPRSRHGQIRRMIAAIKKKQSVKVADR